MCTRVISSRAYAGKSIMMSKIEYKIAMLALAFLAFIMPVRSQWKCSVDTVAFPKWEPHMSVSTGFMGSSYGDNRLYTSVAPSVTFRPSVRWTLNAGFRITSDMGLNQNQMFTTPAKDLAPYKRRNGGTGIASAHVAVQYQASDRLWLAASVYHLGGSYAPVFGFGNGSAFDVSATALSAAASYRFKNDSFLHLSVTYIRDEYGTMPFLYHDAWMHGAYGQWGMYASPTDYYRMAAPYGSLFFGGLY